MALTYTFFDRMFKVLFFNRHSGKNKRILQREYDGNGFIP